MAPSMLPSVASGSDEYLMEPSHILMIFLLVQIVWILLSSSMNTFNLRLGDLTQYLSFRSKWLFGPFHEGVYTCQIVLYTLRSLPNLTRWLQTEIMSLGRVEAFPLAKPGVLPLLKPCNTSVLTESLSNALRGPCLSPFLASR